MTAIQTDACELRRKYSLKLAWDRAEVRKGQNIGKDSDEENWAVVELQGDIRSHSGEISGTQLLGDLHFTKDGTPVLIIGHHLLFGKETKFEKPLAVMEKHQTTDNEIEYRVKAIITKKLLFRTRPKPIIV